MDKDHRHLYVNRDLRQAQVTEEWPRRKSHGILRRGARVPIGRQAPAQLHLSAANLINISLWGALVEHTKRVRVGDVYRLSFPVQGLQVEVLAWAVRSIVSHVIPGAGGAGQIVYRTGLEFLDVENGVTKVLSGYVEHLRHLARAR